MINKLVLENLKHRWVRTFLCALVVGVQVMSILTLIGLSRGLLQDSAQRAKGTGADIWLKPGASFSISTGQVNEKFVGNLSDKAQVHAVKHQEIDGRNGGQWSIAGLLGKTCPITR